jgi:hypothetical protein
MDTVPIEKNFPLEAQRLFDALAEDSLIETDEEVLAEAGVQAGERADEVRLSLLNEVKSYRQRLLNDAMLVYKEEVRRFKAKSYAIPQGSGERRALLDSIFQRFPQNERTFLTLQHRGFKNLTDEDVESCLRQLEALGVLDGDQG